MTTFGFIGSGNMGGALAAAVSRSVGEKILLLADKLPEAAVNLAKKVGGCPVDNNTCALRADYLFLGVKPQFMAEMLDGIRPYLKKASEERRVILITMAAGLTMDRIREMAGGNYPIIRIMPNTPAAIGMGMTLYDAKDVTGQELEAFLKAMAPSGKLEPLSEHLIDAGSSVSGCGPAFVYMMIEALADGGVECGLPRATAQRLAAAMVAGAGEMVLQSGQHPGALKDAVCSPGGTTIAGVHALESGGFRSLMMDAVKAAYDKNAVFK